MRVTSRAGRAPVFQGSTVGGAGPFAGLCGLAYSCADPTLGVPRSQPQRTPAMNPFRKQAVMPEPSAVLPGRATPLRVAERHVVNGNRIVPPFPEGTKLALFGLGCFWGAEKKFWQ